MTTILNNAFGTARHDSVIAEMIAAIDSPAYPRIALRALNRLVPADAAATYIYCGDEVAYIEGDELSHLVDSRFITSYRRFTYHHNPFFQHHRSGLVSGIYTMEQLAKSQAIKKPLVPSNALEIDDGEEIGYRTSGFPKRCSELAIAIRLSPVQTVQIAMYRSGYRAFNSSDMTTLKGLTSTLDALYSRFWQVQELNNASDDNIIWKALRGLSGGSLSNREEEVLLLDLNGGDARNIAERLGITEETVKTHRKRAFSKLQMSTKNDLFLAILRRVMRRGM